MGHGHNRVKYLGPSANPAANQRRVPAYIAATAETVGGRSAECLIGWRISK